MRDPVCARQKAAEPAAHGCRVLICWGLEAPVMKCGKRSRGRTSSAKHDLNLPGAGGLEVTRAQAASLGATSWQNMRLIDLAVATESRC